MWTSCAAGRRGTSRLFGSLAAVLQGPALWANGGGQEAQGNSNATNKETRKGVLYTHARCNGAKRDGINRFLRVTSDVDGDSAQGQQSFFPLDVADGRKLELGRYLSDILPAALDNM
jgi:hypothetical protein